MMHEQERGQQQGGKQMLTATYSISKHTDSIRSRQFHVLLGKDQQQQTSSGISPIQAATLGEQGRKQAHKKTCVHVLSAKLLQMLRYRTYRPAALPPSASTQLML